jgi:hypothetical protein
MIQADASLISRCLGHLSGDRMPGEIRTIAEVDLLDLSPAMLD